MDWLFWVIIVGGLFLYFQGKGHEPHHSEHTSRPVSRPRLSAIGDSTWRAQWEPGLDRSRWIPKSTAAHIVEAYPPLAASPSLIEAARTDTLEDLIAELETINQDYLVRQQTKLKPFFDTVEKNPLTDEQIAACVCMDDAVMVVAAAGSGKTSTMVAKAGYVIHEGLAAPEQILLLAFNRSAANEVGTRIAERLCGVPGVERVRSNTFHAFGIDVIAKATGKKPALAPWVDPSNPGADLREMADIVESLCASDAGFRRDWDRFRTFYARDIKKRGKSEVPEHYANGRLGFLTANGEVVKSSEERFIADWLFYNGVEYQYERAYEHDTSDSEHRQYFPDFYYPQANLYHEHFALDADGKAPEKFGDYAGGVQWKRELHARMETDLFETTSHGVMTGEAVEALEQALTTRGVQLNFDPARSAKGLQPIEAKELIKTFRVFQQHVKNNGLVHDRLVEAVKVQSMLGFGARLRLFLRLYLQIAAEWERRLQLGKVIDFEDMLNHAADHVEMGRYKSPYTVILADEFQDSSRARIRLLKALAKSPSSPTHLCVVGDDWQGINRFAGSDITVMTEFENTFSDSTRLTLNTTFRCPQQLCDASSKFIQSNPAQIKKTVRTTNPQSKTAMIAYTFAQKENIAPYLAGQLEQLDGYTRERKLVSSKGGRVAVLILGRYKSDRPIDLEEWQARFKERLKIDFMTVHASKGLEAEYVFVLNVIQGSHGFPSQIQDDPVLQLAMPTPDPFEYAEERRLFYVAMTRAINQVRFYTTQAQPSQFIVELVKQGDLKIESVEGAPVQPCPKCGNGVLQERTGRYGAFQSCSRFPACDYKRNGSAKDSASLSSQKRAAVRLTTSVKAGEPCPVCRKGVLLERRGKYSSFLGCSRYKDGCRAVKELLQ